MSRLPSESDHSLESRKRLKIDRKVLALVATLGLVGAIKHILNSGEPSNPSAHRNETAQVNSDGIIHRPITNNSTDSLPSHHSLLVTNESASSALTHLAQERFAQQQERAANEAAITAQSISESWVADISARVDQARSRREKAEGIHAAFISQFGPDIGPSNTNYNNACEVARWDSSTHRDSYPVHAILPVWERLYTDKIQAWLQSANGADRERAFVLTLGIELGVEPDVNRTMPNALDIAMGRNDSAIYIGRTSSVAQSHYDWVLDLLNTKISNHQERRRCSGVADSITRERASLATITYSLVQHYPEAISQLPANWWTLLKKEVVLNHLQDILDHFGTWRRIPRERYEAARLYLMGLIVS
ncbi:MAG: hypothetical protein HY817_04300 [Candidatus Abawacabacteria bacterium]|nr:hypothetical protein [Candidatus Abawacabacteria bacterium]